MLFNTIVIVAFTCLVAGAVWLFYNGYAWAVAVTVMLTGMVTAWFAGQSWPERWAFSLTVPFLGVGGTAGFFTYFWMFSFDWFGDIFNSKELGPAGLLLFVCVFAAAIGIFAGWSIHRVLVAMWRPDAAAK